MQSRACVTPILRPREASPSPPYALKVRHESGLKANLRVSQHLLDVVLCGVLCEGHIRVLRLQSDLRVPPAFEMICC